MLLRIVGGSAVAAHNVTPFAFTESLPVGNSKAASCELTGATIFFMSSWHDRIAPSPGVTTAYNVDLSFHLDDEDSTSRSRRLVLVRQALKQISMRDERLASCQLIQATASDWVHISAVVIAGAPGEVAHLSENWMRSAITAANLGCDNPAADLPQQRDRRSKQEAAFESVTAQVSATI